MLENYIKLKASLNKTRFQGRSVRKFWAKRRGVYSNVRAAPTFFLIPMAVAFIIILITVFGVHRLLDSLVV